MTKDVSDGPLQSGLLLLIFFHLTQSTIINIMLLLATAWHPPLGSLEAPSTGAAPQFEDP